MRFLKLVLQHTPCRDRVLHAQDKLEANTLISTEVKRLRPPLGAQDEEPAGAPVAPALATHAPATLAPLMAQPNAQQPAQPHVQQQAPPQLAAAATVGLCDPLQGSAQQAAAPSAGLLTELATTCTQAQIGSLMPAHALLQPGVVNASFAPRQTIGNSGSSMPAAPLQQIGATVDVLQQAPGSELPVDVASRIFYNKATLADMQLAVQVGAISAEKCTAMLMQSSSAAPPTVSMAPAAPNMQPAEPVAVAPAADSAPRPRMDPMVRKPAKQAWAHSTYGQRCCLQGCRTCCGNLTNIEQVVHVILVIQVIHGE